MGQKRLIGTRIGPRSPGIPPIHDHHARFAPAQGMVGDQVFGEFEVEIGGPHG